MKKLLLSLFGISLILTGCIDNSRKEAKGEGEDKEKSVEQGQNKDQAKPSGGAQKKP